MDSYLAEQFDDLPFGSAEKARRYATERYEGAVGLNWYACDPVLRSHLRRHLGDEGLEWAAPHLDRLGALIGGPIAARAEDTDRNPPRLEKHDRWGRDISRVVMPDGFEASKRDLIERGFGTSEFAEQATRAGVRLDLLRAASQYMLDQAEIGMACALATGADMVLLSAEQFAPEDVKHRVRELLGDGSFGGETAQMFTERTGGSDLAALETTATPAGDAWRLNGLKWFVSNANGSAYVVLAKPEGAADGTRGVAPFLVLRERRDGTRNGVRIRRLKDKLGTKAVASAEVELVDAEAFLLAPTGPEDAGEGAAGDGKGLGRMMELTNQMRLGTAMMGLGCARRALVEALCYARAREAFGRSLADQPLMRRKLAEMIVEVEAATALLFDGFVHPELRLAPPLIKLRAARLGITAASDAIEVHGGNGYIEDWPVARILRDAQVNTIWEGPDNILCLDVRRAIERTDAHLPLLDRMRAACDAAGAVDPATVELARRRVDEAGTAVERWSRLDPATAEARLFPLAQLLVDAYAGAVLVEHAAWEADELGGERGALVARLYGRAHLADRDPLGGVELPAEELERFEQLWDGALVDDRHAAALGAPAAATS